MKDKLKTIFFSFLVGLVSTLIQIAYFKVRLDYFEANSDTFKLTYLESILYNRIDSIWMYHASVLIAMTLWSFYIMGKFRW